MLVIDDITLRLGERLLFDHASVQLPLNGRIGLIGRNGVGKTTLFRLMTGEFMPETGQVIVPKRARIARLSQEAPGGPESLIDVVLATPSERTELLAEAGRTSDPMRRAEIETRLADIGAHAAPARAAAILAGLGFPESDQQRPCSEFSGGWRMRVALASVLFAEPDLLLLDEPTNYLDLEGTLWLQAHLARYPHTVVVISHDRDLLDNTVDWTLHLAGGKLTLYRGGYTTFDRRRREKAALDAKLVRQQDLRRKHLESFVERFRAKATKARQAQSRLKMLARLEPITIDADEALRPITIPAPEKMLSPPIIAVENVSIGYEPDRPVLRRLTLRIDEDDRIALLGANGNGKSTLAKLLAGRIAPLGGKVTRADRLSIGYFAQHQLDELDETDSVYGHLRRLMPDVAESAVRARAGSIGFSGDMADTPTGQLSGGEKARLMLGIATMGGRHMVVLDEPTNHLDIDRRASLIEAINTYPGAVILVSHDRYLIEACVDRLWLVGDGTVTPFDGDLDDYRKIVLGGRSGRSGATGTAEEQAARASRSDGRRAAAERRAELAPLRRRIQSAEKAIESFTAEIARLDTALADPGLFATGPERAAQLGKARAAAAAALAAAESDWLEASAAYEAEGI